MAEGTVKFFNTDRGFGFINGDDGKDYYIQESDIEGGKSIKEGDRVSFDGTEGDKGPKAENVKIL